MCKPFFFYTQLLLDYTSTADWRHSNISTPTLQKEQYEPPWWLQLLIYSMEVTTKQHMEDSGIFLLATNWVPACLSGWQLSAVMVSDRLSWNKSCHLSAFLLTIKTPTHTKIESSTHGSTTTTIYSSSFSVQDIFIWTPVVHKQHRNPTGCHREEYLQ